MLEQIGIEIPHQSISIEESYSILFYHPKKLLYQLCHTILQYTLHPKTLLFYFFIKILLFLIFLYYFFHIIIFFQLRGGIKYIYIFFSIVLQYNSKFRILLQHYCKKFCNNEVYHFLMQMFFNYEMPKRPQIWNQHSSMLMLYNG